jgi:hypothetical protein
MATQILDELKRRYAYEAWQGTNALSENLFIRGLFLIGNELPGWRAHRIQDVPAAEWPPMIQSIWIPTGSATEALCSLVIFECASRAEAHGVLLRALGEFQSPQVQRRPQAPIGDVAFAAQGGGAMAFARANVVVLVRDAGRGRAPIAEIAEDFDGDLVRRPALEGVTVVPEIRRFEAAAREIRVGGRVPLEVEAADPLGRSLWYKFFSSPGEVRREDDRLVYQADSAGPQEIAVYAINGNRGAASRQVQLTADGRGKAE